MKLWLIFVVVLVVPTWTFEDCYYGSSKESIGEGANDIIVVPQGDGSLKATPLHVRVGKFMSGIFAFLLSREGKKATLYVNRYRVETQNEIILGSSGEAVFKRPNQKCTFRSSELKGMRLKYGHNNAFLDVEDLYVSIPFSIFLLDQKSQMVVSNIGGTITKGNFFVSTLLPMFGIEIHHKPMVDLLQKISMNGYTVVYLTAQPVLMSASTRKYLFTDINGSKPDNILPRGPLFFAPKALTDVLLEFFDKSISKTKTLKSIINLFEDKENATFPFQAGYGNSETDFQAYSNVRIAADKIYMVLNSNGDVNQTSSGIVKNLKDHVENVDTLFPRIL